MILCSGLGLRIGVSLVFYTGISVHYVNLFKTNEPMVAHLLLPSGNSNRREKYKK